jgi:hypothetical protein
MKVSWTSSPPTKEQRVAERTRRGKLQKARQGKLLCNSRAHYGFKHDETGEAYVIDEEEMAIVQHVYCQVAEGRSLHSVKHALDLEGVPNPSGGGYWGASFLRTLVLEDVYRPHPYAEIEGLVSPERLRLGSTKANATVSFGPTTPALRAKESWRRARMAGSTGGGTAFTITRRSIR